MTSFGWDFRLGALVTVASTAMEPPPPPPSRRNHLNRAWSGGTTALTCRIEQWFFFFCCSRGCGCCSRCGGYSVWALNSYVGGCDGCVITFHGGWDSWKCYWDQLLLRLALLHHLQIFHHFRFLFQRLPKLYVPCFGTIIKLTISGASVFIT